jgi:hypothetical protein
MAPQAFSDKSDSPGARSRRNSATVRALIQKPFRAGAGSQQDSPSSTQASVAVLLLGGRFSFEWARSCKAVARICLCTGWSHQLPRLHQPCSASCLQSCLCEHGRQRGGDSGYHFIDQRILVFLMSAGQGCLAFQCAATASPVLVFCLHGESGRMIEVYG